MPQIQHYFLKLGIDVGSVKPAEQNTQDRPVSSKKPREPQNGEQLEAYTEPVPSGHSELSSSKAKAPHTPTHTPTKEQVLCSSVPKNPQAEQHNCSAGQIYVNYAYIQ